MNQLDSLNTRVEDLGPLPLNMANSPLGGWPDLLNDSHDLKAKSATSQERASIAAMLGKIWFRQDEVTAADGHPAPLLPERVSPDLQWL